MDDLAYLDYVKIIVTCSMWYLCSTGLGIVGKLILYDFPFPMTVTMVQLMTISVMLGPVLPCVGATKRGVYTRRYFVVMMLPLAFGKFASSLSSYISIWRVSVSYAHTVKATLPLFTVVLAKIILGEGQTLPVYLSLLPIITGVGVATMTEVTFDFVGLLFALFSTLFSCLLNIFSKKCLKDVGYHHLQLLAVINRLSTVIFLPVWIVGDLPYILEHSQSVETSHMAHTFFLLVCNGFFNLLNNVFAFSILAKVSPLSYSVANATKRIVIIGGSILVLQNAVSPLNVVGMLTAVFGVLCYNKAKYEQLQAERRERILPYVHSESILPQIGVPHMPHSKSDADFVLNGDLPHTKSILPLSPTAEEVWDESKEGMVKQLEAEAETSSEDSASKGFYQGSSPKLHIRGVTHV
ncbi:solute carrier family 35 member E1 homolog [Babylonia areolata]|uniref:solute carrier family 35 member E1 homolog n=1 Tax=Babylonia areolata TaxID=304850 RepID=UPI003FD22E0A